MSSFTISTNIVYRLWGKNINYKKKKNVLKELQTYLQKTGRIL